MPPAKQTTLIKVRFRFAATQYIQSSKQRLCKAKRYTPTQKYTLLGLIQLRREIIVAQFTFFVNGLLKINLVNHHLAVYGIIISGL